MCGRCSFTSIHPEGAFILLFWLLSLISNKLKLKSVKTIQFFISSHCCNSHLFLHVFVLLSPDFSGQMSNASALSKSVIHIIL